MNTKAVLEILADQAVLERYQIEDVMQEIAQTGKGMIEVLVDFGICTEEQFYHTVAGYLGLEFVDL